MAEGGAPGWPGRPHPLAERLEPAALAIVLAFVFTLIGHVPDWLGQLGRYQALMLVAFAVYGMAAGLRHRWGARPRSGTFVVLVALALRAAVIPVTPSLSDDVYRYVWEGRVIAGGGNPYAHAPADPALARFRDIEIHPRVNHPELRAIYPPVAELGFALVARVWCSLLAFKLWVLLHDMALCALLAWWCRRRGGSAWDALVYAWNPLVVAEYAGSAHHDPTGIFWLVAALALAERRPLASAGAAIAAVLVKLVALPALPFVARSWPVRVRVVSGLVLVAALAGYVAAAHGPASGLEAFANHWRHNDALYGLLSGPWGEHSARLVVACAVAALMMFAWIRQLSTVHATRLLLRAGLLMGPVIQPWYLGWVLALEPLGSSRSSAVWLLLSCTVMLGYGTFALPAEGGAYHPPLAWRLVEYGLPLLLAVALWLTRRVRRAAHGTGPTPE